MNLCWVLIIYFNVCRVSLFPINVSFHWALVYFLIIFFLLLYFNLLHLTGHSNVFLLILKSEVTRVPNADGDGDGNGNGNGNYYGYDDQVFDGIHLMYTRAFHR